MKLNSLSLVAVSKQSWWESVVLREKCTLEAVQEIGDANITSQIM